MWARACLVALALMFSTMVFFVSPIVHADNGTAICAAQSVAGSNAGTCINRIYVISLAAGGVIAVLILVIAGYMYMSGGDNVKAAKKMIFSAVTGLVILFSAYLFLNTINPDLTSFTGTALPDLTCTGANKTNICAAPSTSFPTGTTTGSGTAPTAGQITITGAKSSDDNVQLSGVISGSPSGTFNWVWKSNGTVLTDAQGKPATSASIDTTMDSNTEGTHTDVVNATATDTGSSGTSYSGTATFTVIFDSSGDLVSITPAGSVATPTNGLASPASQAEAKILLVDNSSGTLSLQGSSTDCPGNNPLREVTDISNGNATQSDGPNGCAVGMTSLDVVMLTALHNLASSSSTQGIIITALANGHHKNLTDPHYKGEAVDLVPGSAASLAAVVQGLFQSSAAKVAVECNVGSTHEYLPVSSSSPTNSTCPYGSSGFHIHAQW
jgi:hypothetical protein